MAHFKLEIMADSAADLRGAIVSLENQFVIPVNGELRDAGHNATEETVQVKPAGAKRGRPPKGADAASPASASQTEPEPERGAAPTPPVSEPDDAEEAQANIVDVNAKLRKLIDGGMPTAKLKEVLLAATDGKYGSANQAANAEDQKALNDIADALKLLES